MQETGLVAIITVTTMPEIDIKSTGIASAFMSRPTVRLRWVPKSMMQAMDLKLQQAWEITHYENGKVARAEIEWRDVPVERAP